MYTPDAIQCKFNEIEHSHAVKQLIDNTIDDGEVVGSMHQTATSYRVLRKHLLIAMRLIDNLQDYGNDNMSGIITLINKLREDEFIELERHVVMSDIIGKVMPATAYDAVALRVNIDAEARKQILALIPTKTQTAGA